MSSAISTVSVCVNVPAIVREDIFSCWVGGVSVDKDLNEDGGGAKNEFVSVSQDQYLLFDSMETCLRRPKYFISQRIYFPLQNAIKLRLVERYFSLDESVVREVIGKRIVGKTRRDLDDISKKTMIPLASCRRQFDNLRTIMRRIQERPTDVYHQVKKHFLFSTELSRDYIGALFLNHHLVDVGKSETIQKIPLGTLFNCAHFFIEFWSLGGCSLAFNPDIAHDMRDLRPQLLARRVEWISEIISDVSIDENFKDILRKDHGSMEIIVNNLMKIGCGLVQTHEIRDLLNDIHDLVFIPLQCDLQLPPNQVNIFFESLKSLSFLAQNTKNTFASWNSLLEGLSKCVNEFYRC